MTLSDDSLLLALTSNEGYYVSIFNTSKWVLLKEYW